MNPFLDPLASKTKRPNPLAHLPLLLEGDDISFSTHAARLLVTVLRRDPRWSNEDRPRFDGHPILFKVHRPVGDLAAQWVCALWNDRSITINPESICINNNENILAELSDSDFEIIW